jgi:hypothetical protein
MRASGGQKPPMATPQASGPTPTATGPGMEGGVHTTLHDHGDGTFHTEGHDGSREEHPHIGHALVHMGAKHSEGVHMHVHHDGMGMTSHHHMGGGGQPEGPHEHASADEAADHMKMVMGEGEQDGEGGRDQYDEEPQMSGNLHGM